jgi:fatty-acyl-CoA synthase
VVGVWLPNWVEAVVLEFALASLGAANLGINTRYGAYEISHLLSVGRPVGLAVPREFLGLDFAGRLRDAMGTATEAAPDLAPLWIALFGDGSTDDAVFDVGGGVWAFADDSPARPAAAAGTPARPAAAGTPARPAAAGMPADMLNCFTTSGSTGAPKLAGHDQAAVVKHSRNVAAAFDMGPGDVVLSVLPLSGVFGFNPTMAMLLTGGTCLIEPVFDAAAVLEDMEQFRVTHAVGGDDMLGRLMEAWNESRPPLRALRRGGIADFAGRSGRVIEWADQQIGAKISGVYGSSELFALTAAWPAEVVSEERVRGGGRVVSDEIEVRVVDHESGAICDPETVGELQFRGYNVLTEYLGNPGAAEDAFTADGWFRSGDLGFLTGADGEFVYVCRTGDALRLSGFLVEPAEIERFLMSHPKVEVAKVVGVRAEGEADVAVAYATLQPGEEADAEELMAYCRARLAHFKQPTLLNIIDEFPVTTGTNGTKIRTAELRRWAEQQLAGREPQGTSG